MPQMIDPDRGVDERHFTDLPLRLRTGRSAGSEAPSSASRTARFPCDQRPNPRRTREVFSLMPVSLAALRTISSSIFNVVSYAQ